MVALDSTPGADRWQGGTGGKTERTHNGTAAPAAEGDRALAGRLDGLLGLLAEQTTMRPIPISLGRCLAPPSPPNPVAGLILPLHTIFPRVIAVASSLRFL